MANMIFLMATAEILSSVIELKYSYYSVALSTLLYQAWDY